MKHSGMLKNIMFHLGLMRFLRNLNRNGSVAVLRYHSIINPQENYYASPSIGISPSAFEAQIRYFAKNFNIISLDDVFDCIKMNTEFPAKAIVLTFDDGYRDNYFAYRILKKFDVQATFYVCAACLDGTEILWLYEIHYLINNTLKTQIHINKRGQKHKFSTKNRIEKAKVIREIIKIIKSNDLCTREDIRKQLKTQINDVEDLEDKYKKVMLTWQQVKEMSADGMDIGGHTMTHLNLPNAKEADAFTEINNCKRTIEEHIQKPVKHFSYPNGGKYEYYNETVVNMVKQAGFSTASTSENGLVYPGSSLYKLKRIRVTEKIAEILFQISCEPSVNKILKFVS
jgi:peptidoglycan/xylan/chitin deacetylase (PgdA/CDA1 family)